MSQLPVPPELPDEINDVNLLQWVSNTALQEPDPALHRQMDLPVLFASGIAAWFKTEIDVRIMMYHDPATMLSTLASAADVARLARIARAFYPPSNAIQPNTNFSDHDAVCALFAYWGLYCIQHRDGEDVLYDWLSDIIDWEIENSTYPISYCILILRWHPGLGVECLKLRNRLFASRLTSHLTLIVCHGHVNTGLRRLPVDARNPLRRRNGTSMGRVVFETVGLLVGFVADELRATEKLGEERRRSEA
ncbi:hypothetical protein FIBSPDRAFT_925015 [Athelia psychrophila]|uniref:Uncharacterized protein n=1 Tax=Athelia psychrophila TaxID=1759441 RepID=A0A166V8Z4_9AGAM|nr:hypothetical protein FIBSPDRAFT_925015 [Fibularhizoctonia sp. CBS 109695]